MFPQASPSIYQSPTCSVTYGTMGHVDPDQLPSKGKPWKPVLAQDFIHRVDLIAPQECYELLHRRLVEERPAPRYSRVTMSLGQVLGRDFFTKYIKNGDILMLSEGKTTVNNMFTLRKGVLTMYLDRETYERAGLVGKPYGPKGSRGLKPRWTVVYDLTSDAMVHGKKGFDRLVYSCTKVLSQPLVWLFCNIEHSTPDPDPLELHFPTSFTSSPGIVQSVMTANVNPTLPTSILVEGDRTSLDIAATELYEWLSLVRLQSPRVRAADTIDPYLSRYSAPGEAGGEMALCKMSWQGFMSANWLRDLLVDVLGSCPSQSWFAVGSTGFSKGVTGSCNELTLLRPPKAAGEYLMWQIQASD